jgi:hypothetical protein
VLGGSYAAYIAVQAWRLPGRGQARSLLARTRLSQPGVGKKNALEGHVRKRRAGPSSLILVQGGQACVGLNGGCSYNYTDRCQEDP